MVLQLKEIQVLRISRYMCSRRDRKEQKEGATGPAAPAGGDMSTSVLRLKLTLCLLQAEAALCCSSASS